MTVVGSRVEGTGGPMSGWDYIMSGRSAARYSARTSVPTGKGGGEIDIFGRETGIDVWQDYSSNAPNYNPLDPNRLPDDLKRTALRELTAMVLQAGAVLSDVSLRAVRSGIKATATPAVLLGKEPLKVQLARVVGLPVPERDRSFQLLVALAAIIGSTRT